MMARPDKVIITLEDGRELLVQLRTPSLWRLAIRVMGGAMGVALIFVGGLLLWPDYNALVVYAAFTGLVFAISVKE